VHLDVGKNQYRVVLMKLFSRAGRQRWQIILTFRRGILIFQTIFFRKFRTGWLSGAFKKNEKNLFFGTLKSFLKSIFFKIKNGKRALFRTKKSFFENIHIIYTRSFEGAID